MKEVTLPSGKILKISPAPFADSKALYQAFVAETRNIKIESGTPMASVYKDLFCIGFSSPVVEEKFWICAARCLYNGLKITKDSFEPVEAREDFTEVCLEVAKENINPFVKNLYARYLEILELAEKGQESISKTMTS